MKTDLKSLLEYAGVPMDSPKIKKLIENQSSGEYNMGAWVFTNEGEQLICLDDVRPGISQEAFDRMLAARLPEELIYRLGNYPSEMQIATEDEVNEFVQMNDNEEGEDGEGGHMLTYSNFEDYLRDLVDNN